MIALEWPSYKVAYRITPDQHVILYFTINIITPFIYIYIDIKIYTIWFLRKIRSYEGSSFFISKTHAFKNCCRWLLKSVCFVCGKYDVRSNNIVCIPPEMSSVHIIRVAPKENDGVKNSSPLISIYIYIYKRAQDTHTHSTNLAQMSVHTRWPETVWLLLWLWCTLDKYAAMLTILSTNMSRPLMIINDTVTFY